MIKKMKKKETILQKARKERSLRRKRSLRKKKRRRLMKDLLRSFLRKGLEIPLYYVYQFLLRYLF